MRTLLLVLFLACSPRIIRVPTSTVQDVRVVGVQDRPACYFAARPELPHLKEADYENEDIVRRVFVHMLDWNDLIQYEMSMSQWADDVEKCVLMLTGSEP